MVKEYFADSEGPDNQGDFSDEYLLTRACLVQAQHEKVFAVPDSQRDYCCLRALERVDPGLMGFVHTIKKRPNAR